MARSESAISAIFASRALASSSLVAADFRSLTSSFIAARSSSVSNARFLLVAVLLLADFCVAFAGLIDGTSSIGHLIVLKQSLHYPSRLRFACPSYSAYG